MTALRPDTGKAEERNKSREKIQEFCFNQAELEMSSRYSPHGEITTFEYINLALWGCSQN